MPFTEQSSPNFFNKSKSSDDEADVRQTSYDLIEHDVGNLAKITHLPKPDSFDALQLGSDR